MLTRVKALTFATVVLSLHSLMDMSSFLEEPLEG
jgi:hypothetical protein